MSRSSRKSAGTTATTTSRVGTQSTGPILEQIPGMSDADLANLKVNAERLAEAGTPQQVSAAAEVLPVISRELAVRVERRVEQRRAESAEARAKSLAAR
ncbi:MAG: hypothetical protein ACREER_05025 [Alphaproteobacteria bacterium]